MFEAYSASFRASFCISFYHGDIQRNVLDPFVMVIISVIFFIHTPKVILVGRGARIGGDNPRGQVETRLALAFPLSP